MTAHTPDGGGLTEAEREALYAALDPSEVVPTFGALCTAVERILAARAAHADPRETVAAAWDEGLTAHHVWGFNGTETACRCDHRWRNDRDHIAHVAAEVRAAVGRERDGGGE